GYVLAHLGRPAEAQPLLEKALKADPNSSKVQFQLAGVHRALGKQDQASAELSAFQQQKAQERQQLAAVVKANQGNEDLQTGDARKAVEMYRDAISQDPNNARTYYNLALAEDRLGDIGAEREALEKAEQLDASLALVHNQLGLLDLKANRTDDAQRELKSAIQLDPQYAEAENNLGVLFGQLDRAGEAEHLFRQATENNPQYGQAFANLGIILASQSRLAEAAQALSTAAKLEPG